MLDEELRYEFKVARFERWFIVFCLGMIFACVCGCAPVPF